MRVCKRLQIDYAEAVVDFEFGHRMAVPVIQGVVIATEYHDQVMQELQKDEAERTRKEDEKRRKGALGRWRKFLMGMRIIERIRQDYGDVDDSVSVFGHNKATEPSVVLPDANEEETSGGFLPEGYEEESEGDAPAPQNHTSSFFPVADEDDLDGDNDLIMEDHRQEEKKKGGEVPEPSEPTRTKSKAGSSKPKRKVPQKTRSSRRRRLPVSEEDDDDDDDDDGSEEEWVNPEDDE